MPDHTHGPWPVVRRRSWRGNINREPAHGANVAMVSRWVMGRRRRVRLLKSLALDARWLKKRTKDFTREESNSCGIDGPT